MTNDLTELRFAGGAQGFNWLPVFIAEELGLFTKHGLKISYLRLGSVDKATAAVRDGSADLAITPPEGAVADFVAGGGLRIVAGNAQRLPMSLVARPGIESIAQLRGKRIGTSSLTEGTAIYTQLLLSREGLAYPRDYDFVLAGVHTTRWAALQNGEIDCAPQPAPWNFLAMAAGYNLIGEVNEAIPDVVFAAIIGNAIWLEQNRDTVLRLLRALAEAHSIVNDAAQDAVTLPVYQRLTTPDDSDLARRGLDYTRDMGMWPAGLAVPDAALDATIDLMIRASLLREDQRLAARGSFDPGYLAALQGSVA